MDGERIGIGYTGHPFFDVGLATLTAFADKTDPHDLTALDLEAAARYIEQNYTKQPLKNAYTMAFTPGAWFAQPAFDPDGRGLTVEQRESRRALRQLWGHRHLNQWNTDDGGGAERCVFTDLPIVTELLADNLPVGRAGRSQVPLFQGNTAINFGANGMVGIPISGFAVLALQCLPMGCARAGVGLLAVHSEDNELTFHFAVHFKRRNDADLALPLEDNGKKSTRTKVSLRTLLISTLLEIEEERRLQQSGFVPASVTAYNFNNGQGAKLEIYHLPMETLSFIRKAKANYERTWLELAFQSRMPSGSVRLYEDCFSLPANTPTFARRYFLRPMRRLVVPNTSNAAATERRAIEKLCLDLWSITTLFLREVIRMREEKIQAITRASDRLAEYISEQNAKRFFRAFSTERSYDNFRQRLIGELQRGVKDGTLLIGFNEYVALFQDELDEPYTNWRLIRDLMVIRILERLFELRQTDLVESADDSDDEASED